MAPIKSVRWPRYPVHHDELREMLGLRYGQRLPAHGLPPRIIQGWEVWVEPRLVPGVTHVVSGKRNNSTCSQHRVMAKCPECNVVISAGRTHQHKCNTEGKCKHE